MKMVDGLMNAKGRKPPSPKPSPDGFQWPNQAEADEAVARKIAASLQELLPEKGWKHVDLARALWGTVGANDAPRNTSAARRYILADLPIPNAETAGYIAQLLDVSMARLLQPKGRFNPHPDMIRPRSDSARFPSGNKPPKKSATSGKVDMRGKWKRPKATGKTPGGRDRDKQRAYNEAYRAKKRAEKQGKPKRKYTKRAHLNGADTAASWVLADGVSPPEYTIKSAVDGPNGYVVFELNATLPHERAMAILHMLQTGEEA